MEKVRAKWCIETEMLRKAIEISEIVPENSRGGWKEWAKETRSLVVHWKVMPRRYNPQYNDCIVRECDH